MHENKPTPEEIDERWCGILVEIGFNNNKLAKELGITLEQLEILLEHPDEWRAFYAKRNGNNH